MKRTVPNVMLAIVGLAAVCAMPTGSVHGDAGAPPPPTPKCGVGVVSCGPGGQVADGACPANTYCLTGCCIFPLL
jgi:hypothetical protein